MGINAGVLLANECPIRWLRIFCTRWNVLNKSRGTMDALDDAGFSGGLIYLFENGEEFIKRRKKSNSHEEMPEYVERSYHEALINVFSHREYLVNSRWYNYSSYSRQGFVFGAFNEEKSTSCRCI